MVIYKPNEFTAERPWGAVDIDRLKDASIRLHWTDTAYIWHVNDASEVFVVLDGAVDMHIRSGGVERVLRLEIGHVAHLSEGDEHRAVPIGEARILVIERAGSI